MNLTTTTTVTRITEDAASARRKNTPDWTFVEKTGCHVTIHRHHDPTVLMGRREALIEAGAEALS
jgi:hypothetical protein